ncbi:unnamed protein product [Polarella glacialis]|uniref:XPG-I domain-containing protein n=1 Tax=Polarella glacialis TaxID=89957 RepID=A0A813DKR9_POLGL|nr:unnamed protein product [Polarella glacialis]
MKIQGVECIVAPCEADAQLAHLALTGRIDVCVSEDSDLLAFGCPRVLFGFDPRSGRGREVKLSDLGLCRGLAPYRLAAESLPDLCVLAGCDYLPSLPRLGIKTVAQLLHRSGGKVSRALQLARREGIPVPGDFERQFEEARLVFASQVVFNTTTAHLQPLRPLPALAPEDKPRILDFLGLNLYTDEMARGIAEGRVNPFTLESFLVPAVRAVSTPCRSTVEASQALVVKKCQSTVEVSTVEGQQLVCERLQSAEIAHVEGGTVELASSQRFRPPPSQHVAASQSVQLAELEKSVPSTHLDRTEDPAKKNNKDGAYWEKHDASWESKDDAYWEKDDVVDLVQAKAVAISSAGSSISVSLLSISTSASQPISLAGSSISVSSLSTATSISVSSLSTSTSASQRFRRPRPVEAVAVQLGTSSLCAEVLQSAASASSGPKGADAVSADRQSALPSGSNNNSNNNNSTINSEMCKRRRLGCRGPAIR